MSEAIAHPPENNPAGRHLELVPDPQPDDLAREVELHDLITEDEIDSEAFATEDPVRLYLRQIGKVSLLTAIEEVELSKRIEAGLYAGKKLQYLTSADKQGVLPELGTVIDRSGNPVSRPDIAEAFAKSSDTASLNTIGDLQDIRTDGLSARAKLIESNLRLVVSLAKLHTHRGLPFLDLIQEGNAGLIRAVEKFDYIKGYKFSTYATWWIRQAIGRGIADQARTIRIPVHEVEQIHRMNRQERKFINTHGRIPSNSELAELLDIKPGKVEDLKLLRRGPSSLDKNVSEDSNLTVGDLIADADVVEAEEAAAARALRSDLTRLLESLPKPEADVIRWRYGFDTGQPLTSVEIGQLLGISAGYVRQIERRALAKLQDPVRASKLEGFLEA